MPQLQPVGRVSFDPPLTVKNGEVLSVEMKLTAEGIELLDAQVLTPEQQDSKLRASVIKVVMAFSEGLRLREIPCEMESQGYFVDTGDLMQAIFDLITIRALDLSTESIVTIHKREE